MTLLSGLIERYDSLTATLAGKVPDSILLAFVRVVLAGIFWRSGETKVEPGTWFQVTETTYELFRTEYAGVPLPPEVAALAATAAEHIFPALLVAGLFTRFAALGLLGMTLTIQFFVYPEAWWPVHSLWAALALVLMLRGGGWLGLDALLTRGRR